MRQFNLPIPLTLYVHTPWCVQKCPYCDFNSHTLKDSLPEAYYVEQLLKDLENDLPQVWGRSVQSIFIGGGTPSLFSPEEISRLINGIRARLNVNPHAEITLEANPGTVEQQRFTGYLEAGINRLSIGIQSFDPHQLKTLGRIHTGQEASQAIHAAQSAGFSNINLDLMFALPNQTVDSALVDLRQAIDLAPTHLSWYQLTLEPNTPFYRQPPPVPEDDEAWEIQLAGLAALNNAGYASYEISAHAKPGAQCQHNLNYWQFGDYLGIGAGAHSKITDMNRGSITRAWKFKHPKAYLNATSNFVQDARELDNADVCLEFMMNALRLSAPTTFDQFQASTGLTPDVIKPALHQLIQHDLITYDAVKFGTTARGKQYLNEVLAQFLSPKTDTVDNPA